MTTRKLWEVWQNEDGRWMVQGPKAQVGFTKESTARAVAEENARLDTTHA